METNHALDQARAQYESIIELITAYECDFDRLEELNDMQENLDNLTADELEELDQLTKDAGGYSDQDEALTAIQENVLDVQVRSDWVTPGQEFTASEFNILLCTGGPAVRILGELDDHGIPSRAYLEYQDWGTPWTHYHAAGQSVLLQYSQLVVGEV